MTERRENHLDDQTLFLYLDLELEAGDELAARNHLADCVQCQGHLRSLRSLYTGLDGLEDLALGRDLSPSILAEIRRTQRRAAPAYLLLASQLLVVVAVLGLSWSYLAQLAVSNYWDLASTQTAAFFTSTATQLATQWESVQADLAGLAAWIQGLVQVATTSQAPPVSGWPWLVAATLLWVLGNGFLLQGNRPTQRNRSQRS
jgi:predicted anti-sigma-YlaC factor YlaD